MLDEDSGDEQYFKILSETRTILNRAIKDMVPRTSRDDMIRKKLHYFFCFLNDNVVGYEQQSRIVSEVVLEYKRSDLLTYRNPRLVVYRDHFWLYCQNEPLFFGVCDFIQRWVSDTRKIVEELNQVEKPKKKTRSKKTKKQPEPLSKTGFEITFDECCK